MYLNVKKTALMFEISWLKFDVISLISLLSSKKCSSEESEELPLTDLSGFFCGLLEPGKFAEVGSVRFVPFRWTNVQSLFVHTLRLRECLPIVGWKYLQLALLLQPFLVTPKLQYLKQRLGWSNSHFLPCTDLPPRIP